MSVPPADAVDVVTGFARTLRAAGLDASSRRLQTTVHSLAVLDPHHRDDVYWAGRLSLCASHDDVIRYDAAFDAYFGGEAPHLRLRTVAPPHPSDLLTRPDADAAAAEAESDGELPVLTVDASTEEQLRHRDFAEMTPAERDLADRLLDRFRLEGETRRTRRHQPGRSASLDRSRIVREALRHGGEPGRLHRRQRRRRPRRVVLLVDVSGSMAGYASALLRFAHAAGQGRRVQTEVFTIGTRLTRVTEHLAHRDPDTALAAVSREVPDWSGGTRLGRLLREYLDRWGQRGMARGAVVVVLSDGWERDDVSLLGSQMERLARLAHRVVWSNPRQGRPGFEPTAAGMAAALPHVDDFVSGHSVAALEQLADVVAGTADPRAARLRSSGHAASRPGRA